MNQTVSPSAARVAAVLLATSSLAFAQWTPKTPALAPSARSAPAMTFDFTLGQVLLFGGGAPFINGETWAYDGVNWTQLSPATSPTARFGAQMVYDQARGVTVLYGGLASNISIPPPNSDTWEFDGATWTQATPATNPGPRYRYGASYDVPRGRMVIYGGVSSQLPGAPNSQTWEYSGTNWAQIVTTGNPGGRDRPAMCYHPGLDRTVLFGGSDASGLTDQTWLYNGVTATWTQLVIPGTKPSPRNAGAMVYDPVRNLCVLRGGQNTAGPLADTWTFDGATWMLQPLDPETIRDHGLAFSPLLGQVVKFGGFVAGPNILSNQTLELGSGVIGTGCAGTNGVPTLSTAGGPLLGQPYTLDIANMNPAISIAALVFGFPQLPGVDLAIIGMPTCLARTTPDVVVTVVGAAGTGSWTWPSVAGLVGDSWYAQALCLDPTVNAFGFTITNAVFATIGG